MHAARRAAAALGLSACALAALPAASAQADTTVTAKPPVVKANWYWFANGASAAGESLPELPTEASAASNVPEGDLGVGYLAEQLSPSDKVSAIGFDLTTIPAGSTFTKMTVTVPMDGAATQVMTGQPSLSACENIDRFKDGVGGESLAKAPPISSPSCVEGVFTAGKGYVFDITPIANDWSFGAPAEGISLIPTPGSEAFSLALLGKNAILTSATYTLTEAAVAPETPSLPELAPPVAQPGGAVAVLQPSVPQVEVPQPQALPQQPAPQVNPAPQAPTRTVVAAAYVSPTTVPTTLWWLAILGGLVVLGATRIVLADPMAPAPADPRRARFADVVRAQTTH